MVENMLVMMINMVVLWAFWSSSSEPFPVFQISGA